MQEQLLRAARAGFAGPVGALLGHPEAAQFIDAKDEVRCAPAAVA